MRAKKHKKVTVRSLPFLYFLPPFEKSLKIPFFSTYAIVPVRAAYTLSCCHCVQQKITPPEILIH